MTILSVKLLGIVLALQVLLGLVLVALVATDNLPFTDGEADGAASRSAPPAKVDRFDGRAAYDLLVEQVELGPRPAGSQASQELAARLKRLVPRGRYQAVPGGLRNVIGTVRGRERGYVVVGAHYDTKDIPRVRGGQRRRVGHRRGRSARAHDPAAPPHDPLHLLRRRGESRRPGPCLPAARAARGQVAAPRFDEARAMVLLDFVGERRLRIPREANSNERLWRQLRAAARRVGTERVFPSATQGGILDDHIPFLREECPRST